MMKLFWVGEESEIFLAESIQQIKELFYSEDEWECLDGDYGEVKNFNMQTRVYDEDPSFIGAPESAITYLANFLEPSQVFSSY